MPRLLPHYRNQSSVSSSCLHSWPPTASALWFTHLHLLWWSYNKVNKTVNPGRASKMVLLFYNNPKLCSYFLSLWKTNRWYSCLRQTCIIPHHHQIHSHPTTHLPLPPLPLCCCWLTDTAPDSAASLQYLHNQLPLLVPPQHPQPEAGAAWTTGGCTPPPPPTTAEMVNWLTCERNV